MKLAVVLSTLSLKGGSIEGRRAAFFSWMLAAFGSPCDWYRLAEAISAFGDCLPQPASVAPAITTLAIKGQRVEVIDTAP